MRAQLVPSTPLVLVAFLVLAGAPAPGAAAGYPTDDTSEPARLIGGERLVYAFDEDDLDLTHPGSVADASGEGAHGTMFDGTDRVVGVHGDALKFDAANDRVRVDDASSLAVTASAFTVAAWVRPDAACCPTRVIIETRTANGVVPYGVYLTGGSTVHVQYARPTASSVGLNTGIVVPIATWSHVAVAYNGADVMLAINGNQVWSAAIGPLYAAFPIVQASVGANNVGGGGFIGALDEARVYDRVLNAAELRSIKDLPYFHPNSPPVALAGEDVAVPCAGARTDAPLDASGSSDPEGDALTFAWSSAEAAGFADAAAAVTTGTFPVGTSTATVTVADAEYAVTDEVRVHVVDGAPPVIGAHWPNGPGAYAGDAGAAGGDEIVVLGGITLRAEAEDACSSVAHVVFSVDDGTVAIVTEAPYAFHYAPEGLGIQYRIASIVAVDEHGNASPPVEVPLTVVALAPRGAL